MPCSDASQIIALMSVAPTPRHCLVATPANSIGPLFVAFNGLTGTLQIRELTITVEGAATGT
jgi:hypothetical protein